MTSAVSSAPPASAADPALPSVSVIIPNYNHARFLARALNAFLRQSVPPHQIIVVNDGSTDHSLDVLRDLARHHPTLEILENPRNLGVVPSMNRGLERARADYVLFSAADDEVRPALLEASLRLLQLHPRAGLCSSLSEWRCAESNLAWTFGAGMPAAPAYLSPDDMVTLGRRGRLAISGPNTLFRRTALIEAGGWVPALRWYCDFFGAYVVGFRHGICHVPEVLAQFNLSPGSYYHSARNQAERRAVLDHLLALLLDPACADVAPRLRASGILGTLGGPMLRVVLARRTYYRFLTFPFLRQVLRRQAEVLGRRWFPPALARWCLRTFYARR